MKKRTKLPEKPARMPDLFEFGRVQKFRDYIKEMAQYSEPARSKRFLILLNELFGEVHPKFVEDYLRGVEKYLRFKKTDFVLKGRADVLYGNLVIEFERDLNKKLSEAQDQLKKYMAILWSDEADRKVSYLCLASDGINFRIYSPKAKDVARPLKPEEIELEEVDRIDFSSLKEPDQAYFWLDRYLFRRHPRSPKTEEFDKDFGKDSHAFKSITLSLERAWQGVRDKSDFQVIYKNWDKYLRITYGGAIGDEPLFIRHTYLATLAKLIAWMRLTEATSLPPDEEIFSVLEGKFFERRGIANFLEEDFFSWNVREEVKDEALKLSKKLLSLLFNYNLKEISEDVLKYLYQELVDPEARHDLGEYYTPDWLAERMVKRALKDEPEAAVLDPACGSGTFLYL